MKPVLDSLEGVPEGLHDEYEQRDGRFYLKLDEPPEGYVPAPVLAETTTKLNEFRSTNRALFNKAETLETQLRSLKEKYGDIDPNEYADLKKKLADLEQRGVRGAEDVTARINKALEDYGGPLKQQVQDLTLKLEEAERKEKEAERRVQQKDLEQKLASAGLAAGVSESALPDYIGRGLRVWQVEDGRPVAKNGDAPLVSQKTGQALSMEEWAVSLQREAPHLFKPSKGGGAPGDKGSTSSTPQRVIADDPLEFGRAAEDILSGKVIVEGSA